MIINNDTIKTQDLSSYALKSELPNMSNYALKSDIPSTSGFIKIPSPNYWSIYSSYKQSGTTTNNIQLANYYVTMLRISWIFNGGNSSFSSSSRCIVTFMKNSDSSSLGSLSIPAYYCGTKYSGAVFGVLTQAHYNQDDNSITRVYNFVDGRGSSLGNINIYDIAIKISWSWTGVTAATSYMSSMQLAYCLPYN